MNANNSIPLNFNGNVFDLYTMDPLTNVKSEVLQLPDSTVVSSNIAGSYNGSTKVFTPTSRVQFHIDDRTKKYVVRFSLDGYNPEYLDINPDDYGKRTSEITIKPIYLERKAKKLNNLDVVASKIKFYHRGDTLVYNADAFVLPEGSMLDALLEQLPGVHMDGNGVITVNGKTVDYLLLDGKEFFSRDKRLMLKNIASYGAAPNFRG